MRVHDAEHADDAGAETEQDEQGRVHHQPRHRVERARTGGLRRWQASRDQCHRDVQQGGADRRAEDGDGDVAARAAHLARQLRDQGGAGDREGQQGRGGEQAVPPVRQDVGEAMRVDLGQAHQREAEQRGRDRRRDQDPRACRHVGAEQVEHEHQGKCREARGPRGHERQQRVQRRAEGPRVGCQGDMGAEHHPETHEAGGRADEAGRPAIQAARDGHRSTEHRVGEADQQHDRAGQQVGDRGAGTGQRHRRAGQHDHAAADHLLERHAEHHRQAEGRLEAGGPLGGHASSVRCIREGDPGTRSRAASPRTAPLRHGAVVTAPGCRRSSRGRVAAERHSRRDQGVHHRPNGNGIAAGGGVTRQVSNNPASRIPRIHPART